jgi:hypothetical protein
MEIEMALKREWFPSDTIKLINRSEDHLVRDGRLQTPAAAGEDPTKGAHAIGRHLLSSAPGALGNGVTTADFRDRFLDAAGNVSSVWLGKGDMSMLLCEMLNSRIGQAALNNLDLGVRRIAVHYLNLKALSHMTGNLTMQESNMHVTPASETLVDFVVTNSKTGAYIKTIQRRQVIPAVRTGVVTVVDIGMVHAVLDRHGANLHLQTLFPSSELAESTMDWRIGSVSMRGAFVSDSLTERVIPAL